MAKEFSDKEIKWLLFYGTPSEDSKTKLDNDGSLDYAINHMFELLEEHTIYNRKEVERIFWNRIKTLSNKNI